MKIPVECSYRIKPFGRSQFATQFSFLSNMIDAKGNIQMARTTILVVQNFSYVGANEKKKINGESLTNNSKIKLKRHRKVHFGSIMFSSILTERTKYDYRTEVSIKY